MPSESPGSSSSPTSASSAFEQLFPLATQVRGHVLVHVVEHGRSVVDVARGERAVTLRDLLCRDHLVFRFFLCAGVLLVGPCADADEVLLQPSDRIAQRKARPVIGGAVSLTVVRSA